jgi:hypothetical protein
MTTLVYPTRQKKRRGWFLFIQTTKTSQMTFRGSGRPSVSEGAGVGQHFHAVLPGGKPDLQSGCHQRQVGWIYPVPERSAKLYAEITAKPFLHGTENAAYAS